MDARLRSDYLSLQDFIFRHGPITLENIANFERAMNARFGILHKGGRRLFSIGDTDWVGIIPYYGQFQGAVISTLYEFPFILPSFTQRNLSRVSIYMPPFHSTMWSKSDSHETLVHEYDGDVLYEDRIRQYHKFEELSDFIYDKGNKYMVNGLITSGTLQLESVVNYASFTMLSTEEANKVLGEFDLAIEVNT